MARVRLFKSFLEDEFEDIEVSAGKAIGEVVMEHGEDGVYTDSLVECYDIETGETTYCAITDDENFGAVVCVGGEEKDLDYVLQDDDICTVIITPCASGQQGGWNWWGAVIGVVAGAILGLVTGGIGFAPGAGLALTFSWAGAGIGAGVGAAIGFLAGGIAVGQLIQSMQQKSDYDTGERGSQLPDISGSANQPITGNPIPLVLGKMEVSPFILASSHTSYGGIRGGDTYIRILYCLGYSPLKVTGVKFAGLRVCDNYGDKGTLMRGRLTGDENNGGDIKHKWFSNDISMEIIQQDHNSDEIYRGEIYPTSFLQVKANSTPMYIKDSYLSDLQTEQNESIVQYKGYEFPDGFRTNSIRFSEQYPRKVSVVLDFPSGIYRVRSKDGSQEKSSVPCWVAIQWRPYNQNNSDTDAANANEYSEKNQSGWISFDTINGVCHSKVFTEADNFADAKAHTGNSLITTATTPHTEPYTLSEAISLMEWFNSAEIWTVGRGTKLCKVRFYTKYDNRVNGGNPVVLGSVPESVYSQTLNSRDQWGDSPYGTAYYIYNDDKSYIFTNWPYKTVSSTSEHADYNEGWTGKKVFNIQDLQDAITDRDGKFNMSEFRCTTEVDLKDWCDAHNKNPKKFLWNSDNTTKSVEVRVIRVSPDYIDETKGDSSTGPYSFQTQFSWSYINTEPFDPDKGEGLETMELSHPVSDAKLRKMCCLALECKLDKVGNVANQLEKVSLTLEAFAPKWNAETRRWMPYISPKKGYYRKVDGLLAPITKEEYEEDRQNGIKSEATKAGNDWIEKIDEIIFRNASTNTKNHYLSEEAASYVNNSCADMFMLACVGQHLGIDAFGYDKIHELSLGEWREDTVALRDGRTERINTGTEQDPVYEDKPVEVFMACNGYVYQAQKLDTLLQKVCVTGRAGYTLDDNGKLIVVMDKYVPYPRGMLTNQTALQTSVVYDFQSPPSGYMITFKNEDNFYIDEGLSVMADGENYKDPKKEMLPASIDFVTNIDQIWTLGRYLMAVGIYSKRAISWKAGIEALSLGFGDVVKVTSDALVIGQGGGRISEFIEDDEFIYGFILDNTYEYPGMPEGAATNPYGVEILQPVQYDESKVITVRLNGGAGLETKSGLLIESMKAGITNKVVFAERMSKNSRNTVDGQTFFFVPKVGDLVCFGEIGSITKLYRIKSKVPDAKFTFTLSLVPYDERFFNYGAELPEMPKNTPNMNNLRDDTVTLDDTVDTTTIYENIQQIVSESGIDPTEPPDVPEDVQGRAVRDGIELFCTIPSGGFKNTIKRLVWEITRKDGSKGYIETSSASATYMFDRATDGYPEAEDLADWTVSVHAVNQYGNSGNESGAVAVDTDFYGTWKLTPPSVDVQSNGRLVTLSIAQSGNAVREEYGSVQYRIQIAKFDDTREMNELDYYEPALDKNSYESEENYRTDSSSKFVTVKNVFTQSLPLEGQNDCTWKIAIVANKSTVTYEETAVAESTYKPGLYYIDNGTDYVVADGAYNSAEIYYSQVGVQEQKGFVDYTAPAAWTDEDKKGVAVLAEKLASLGVVIEDGYIKSGGSSVKLQTSLFAEATGYTADVRQLSFINEQQDLDGNITESTDVYTCANFTVSNFTIDGTEYSSVEFYCTPEFAGNPKPTGYVYKVIPKNESPNNNDPKYVLVSVLATTARDMVNAAITTNKLAKDCITGDKIHAGTITADKMSVKDLSAICARFGKITSTGMNIADAYNKWDLETGEFRIGDDKNYLHAVKASDGTYSISMSLTSFYIDTEIGTVVQNGLTVVGRSEKEIDALKKTVITKEGLKTFTRPTTADAWALKSRVVLDDNNNVVFGNGEVDSMWRSVQRIGDIVYHFNGSVDDSNGGNAASLEFRDTHYVRDNLMVKDNDGSVSAAHRGEVYKTVGANDEFHIGFWHRGKINVTGTRINVTSGATEQAASDFISVDADFRSTIGLTDSQSDVIKAVL